MQAWDPPATTNRLINKVTLTWILGCWFCPMGVNDLHSEKKQKKHEALSFFRLFIPLIHDLFPFSCLLCAKWQKQSNERLCMHRHVQMWILLRLEAFYDPDGWLHMRRCVQMWILLQLQFFIVLCTLPPSDYWWFLFYTHHPSTVPPPSPTPTPPRASPPKKWLKSKTVTITASCGCWVWDYADVCRSSSQQW